MRKILTSIICCLISLGLLCGCADSNSLKSLAYKGITDKTTLDGIVAENADYQLKINEKTAGIILENKKTHIQWGTSPVETGEVKLDELGMPIKRHPQVESVLKVNYIDSKTGEEQTAISYTASVSSENVNYIKNPSSKKEQDFVIK